MAFENIGMGGVLTFDSKGAVNNMGAASRAFDVLGRSASQAQSGVQRIASGLGAFQMMGAGGLIAAGVGLKGMVAAGGKFNSEMETSELAIATILSQVTKAPLDSQINVARDAMKKLNRVAAEAPGELTDIVNIFQMMTGPIISAGGSMNQLLDNTKGVAILAGVLKRPFSQAGQDMAKLAMGAYEAGNDLHLSLKSMGLLKETTQEWKDMLPQKRLERINQILGSFAVAGDRVGKTMEAQRSTTASIIKQLQGAFVSTMFDGAKGGLTSFNDNFFKSEDAWMAKAKNFGREFSKVVTFLIGQVKTFGNTVLNIIDFINDKFDAMGVSVDQSVVKKVAGIITQFLLFAAVLSPIVTIIGFIASKIMAVVSIVMGLGTVLMAVFWPLTLIAAAAGAIYIAFKQVGEGPVDFLARGLEYVKKIVTDIQTDIQNSLSSMAESFGVIGNSAAALWAGIQPGMDAFRASVEGLVQFVATSFTYVLDLGAIIVEGFAMMFEAIRPGIEAVFNGLMTIVNVIVDGVNFIMPKIMAVLTPILKVIMFLGEKIAMVLGKAFQFLRPILDGIAYLLKEVIFPVLGWIVDTFGPVVTAIFEAIGFVLGKIADAVGWLFDKMGGLLEIVGGGLKLAFEAIGFVVKGIGWVIENLIITPIKWLAEKLIWIGQKVKSIISDMAEGGLLSGMKSELEGMMEKWYAEQADKGIHNVADQTNAFYQGLIKNAEAVKAANMSVNDSLQYMAKFAGALYDTAIKPLYDAGMKVIQMFAPDITANKGDINVKVDVNNKAMMCVNGRQMSVAQAEYQTEVSERSGYNKTPWQTQRVHITGTNTGPTTDPWG